MNDFNTELGSAIEHEDFFPIDICRVYPTYSSSCYLSELTFSICQDQMYKKIKR